MRPVTDLSHHVGDPVMDPGGGSDGGAAKINPGCSMRDFKGGTMGPARQYYPTGSDPRVNRRGRFLAAALFGVRAVLEEDLNAAVPAGGVISVLVLAWLGGVRGMIAFELP